MAHIHVAAGRTLLETYVKTPATGLCELIWNAFDDDATDVVVSVEVNELGGIAQIQIQDDGNGMTRERAERAFATVGDSWKLMPGTLSQGGRPVHGRHGRGRYAAFSLGNQVTWTSTSNAVDGGGLTTVRIRGQRSNLSDFEIDDDAGIGISGTGTRVVIGNPSTEAVTAFEEATELTQRLLMEFALHLERHPDFRIELVGTRIDPAKAISERTELDLPMPEGVEGSAKLTIIEWNLENVERRLYLCAEDGSIRDELPPGVQAPGAQFTAFLAWKGFDEERHLVFDGDEETQAGQILQAAKTALRAHLSAALRRGEAETVRRWKAEGVYPYKTEPVTPVERATRDTFNLVAMAASRTVDDARSRSSKSLALRLLKETFESNPEALLPILTEVSKLPAARIDELRSILERTTLTQLIALGHAIGGRLDFISGLNALVFDTTTKQKMLERRQLHRILAHETWLFGEEWSLTGDDERLVEVLKKFLDKLGLDVELANEKPILREDGSVGIPDLVLGRSLETRANHFEYLVVELKRPNHTLTDEDVTQIRSYASAITNDERFDQPNVTWEFWLLGNDTTKAVDEARDQQNSAFGLVQNSKKYRVMVKTWAEIIGDAQHRLKFVQQSLEFESNRDTGLQHMREQYAQYLPVEASEDQVAGVVAEDAAPAVPEVAAKGAL